MDLNNFYYDLDESFIAQSPIKNRSDSKLLVVNRLTGTVFHETFFSILKFLNKGDCLIFNDSKVLKARIFGINSKTKAKLEFLLLNEIEFGVWKALCKPAKRVRAHDLINFEVGMNAVVLNELDEGLRILKFGGFTGDFLSNLDRIGKLPLPPYIKTELIDQSRYQTIYSKNFGSVAAPTAGLHFTAELLEELKKKGIKLGFLTLHVGLGTFRPVKVSNIVEHKMHFEQYFLSQEVADLINETKKNGNRVFCVGTTSCRTLESVFLKKGRICADCGFTNLFIYPGFSFNVMDGLITNFHLPFSTLLMLVSAFASKSTIFSAYEQAKKFGYRFFSFGDAMLIL